MKTTLTKKDYDLVLEYLGVYARVNKTRFYRKYSKKLNRRGIDKLNRYGRKIIKLILSNQPLPPYARSPKFCG